MREAAKRVTRPAATPVRAMANQGAAVSALALRNIIFNMLVSPSKYPDEYIESPGRTTVVSFRIQRLPNRHPPPDMFPFCTPGLFTFAATASIFRPWPDPRSKHHPRTDRKIAV